MDLMYNKLFYNLYNALSKKYGIWLQNVPENVAKYVSRKALLLESK